MQIERVLLTGGCGLVGRTLAPMLRDNYSVTHLEMMDPGDGLPFIEGDLCNALQVAEACNMASADRMPPSNWPPCIRRVMFFQHAKRTMPSPYSVAFRAGRLRERKSVLQSSCRGLHLSSRERGAVSLQGIRSSS